MSITFQDIYHTEKTAGWMSKPFTGFSLDSRKVDAGQIFIALTSFSQPEKPCSLPNRLWQGGLLLWSAKQI